MAYAVYTAQQLNEFLVDQFGVGPVESNIDSYFTQLNHFPVSVDTAQGTGAELEILSPVSNEISVNTTVADNQQLVVDQNSSATTEDFDVSGIGAIAVMLTAPQCGLHPHRGASSDYSRG